MTLKELKSLALDSLHMFFRGIFLPTFWVKLASIFRELALQNPQKFTLYIKFDTL